MPLLNSSMHCLRCTPIRPALPHRCSVGDLFAGETSLAGIAPLEETLVLAVGHPLADQRGVIIVQTHDGELDLRAGRELLAACEGDALALCGLSTERTLAQADLSGELERNLAGLGEDAAINDLLEGFQLR